MVHADLIQKEMQERCKASYQEVEYVVHDLCVNMFCVENAIEADSSHMVASNVEFDTSKRQISVELWIENEVSAYEHVDTKQIKKAANDASYDQTFNDKDLYTKIDYDASAMPELYNFLAETESLVPEASINKLSPQKANDYIKKARAAVDELYVMAEKVGVLNVMAEKPEIAKRASPIRGV